MGWIPAANLLVVPYEGLLRRESDIGEHVHPVVDLSSCLAAIYHHRNVPLRGDQYQRPLLSG